MRCINLWQLAGKKVDSWQMTVDSNSLVVDRWPELKMFVFPFVNG